MADPSIIGAYIGTTAAAAFAAWSHFFSGKRKNGHSDPDSSKNVTHKDLVDIKVAIAANHEITTQLKSQVDSQSVQLSKIQRSLGRLEGRSETEE